MLRRQTRGILAKPPLGSEIAWGDPLARGLISAWAFNEGAGNRTNNLVAPADVAVWTTAGVWGPGGAQMASMLINASLANDPASLTPSTQILWAFPYDITSAGQYVTDYSIASGPTDNYHAIILAFQSGNWNMFNNVAYPTGTASDTQMAAAAYRWNMVAYSGDGTTLKGYRDGVLTVSVSASLTPTAQLVTAHLGAGRVGSDPFTGRIGLVLRYNRMLSDDEILALYRDPYAFMRPAVKRRLILDVPAAAGGGGSFKAVWATGASQIVSWGGHA